LVARTKAGGVTRHVSRLGRSQDARSSSAEAPGWLALGRQSIDRESPDPADVLCSELCAGRAVGERLQPIAAARSQRGAFGWPPRIARKPITEASNVELATSRRQRCEIEYEWLISKLPQIDAGGCQGPRYQSLHRSDRACAILGRTALSEMTPRRLCAVRHSPWRIRFKCEMGLCSE